MFQANTDMGHIGDMSRCRMKEERRARNLNGPEGCWEYLEAPQRATFNVRSKYRHGTYRGHEKVSSEGGKTGENVKWKGILRG